MTGEVTPRYWMSGPFLTTDRRYWKLRVYYKIWVCWPMIWPMESQRLHIWPGTGESGANGFTIGGQLCAGGHV